MPSKQERELLFNHALEVDDIEYAKELATPNGYSVVLNHETGAIYTEPAWLSEEELATVEERERRLRMLTNYAIDPHLDRRFPGSLDCTEKRSMGFYE